MFGEMKQFVSEGNHTDTQVVELPLRDHESIQLIVEKTLANTMKLGNFNQFSQQSVFEDQGVDCDTMNHKKYIHIWPFI